MSAARYRNAKGDIAKGKIVQETIGMLNQERRRFVIEIEGVWYLAGRDRIHRKVCQIFTETSTKPEVVAEAEQLKVSGASGWIFLYFTSSEALFRSEAGPSGTREQEIAPSRTEPRVAKTIAVP